jgi:hypothetical protein
MNTLMSSAAEAELGALFINAKTAVPMRRTLEELGHPQPPTPVQTDNSTAYGVINKPQKQWTCNSIGSRIGKAWTNFGTIGAQVRITWPITGPSTIQPSIINICEGLYFQIQRH